MNPRRYSPELAATIYASRRVHAIHAVLETENPVAFDAGCGYGSESFLFAALGARVLAVDLSVDQIAIASNRQRYYEEAFGKPFDIRFLVANLDEYIPHRQDISLTWLASVLAAIQGQEGFLKRVYTATRQNGTVMITDMNLRNPLFLWGEWRRRRRVLRESPEFARHTDFWAMFRRKGRTGARYFPCIGKRSFDDVQFFTSRTLSNLLVRVGFSPSPSSFSGFVPPFFARKGLHGFENSFTKMPVLRSFGYFYVVAGVKR
jgi:SAM-dependent methyltransferase